MSEHDLAARIGVARSTLELIEQGNPSVAIGLVLEAAILTDVDLFVPEVKTLAPQIERIEDKLALNHRPARLFAWIWLLGKTTPMVADRVHAEGNYFVFTYGCSYLAREDAIPAYAPELSLNPGGIAPEPPLKIANVLRDASPDAPKCRGIIHRLVVAAVKRTKWLILMNSPLCCNSVPTALGRLTSKRLRQTMFLAVPNIMILYRLN